MKEYKKRCDVCGAEFIAKHKKGRYCSNKCRNKAQSLGVSAVNVKAQKVTDDQLVEACKTLTLNEIAEKYNMHPYSLPKRLKRLGVSPKQYDNACSSSERMRKLNERIAKGEIKPSNPKLDWHYVKTHETLINNSDSGFDYIESKQKKIRLRCKQCGEIVERELSTARKYKTICESCKERKNQDKIEQDARATLVRFLYALKESKTPKICVGCGKEFYSQYATQKYCSQKCKHKKKDNSIRRRCRKYNTIYDPAVKSHLVILRDNGVCKICGKKCDSTDLRWGSFGPDFPTVDHIIPLAQGGTHTWDNVQCACAICNSNKRDLITV